MPSPFPGMNPYLEQNDSWQDFHQGFLLFARESLSGQVGPNYLVKLEMHVILHEIPAEERRFLGVADMGVGIADSKKPEATAATLEVPVLLELPEVEVKRHASLEIQDRRDRRVITVIELLSPSNKRPKEDRDNYLANRRHVLRSQTNLVEIDLRRGGLRPEPPELPVCDYYVLVSPYVYRPRAGFWPIGLRDPLPVIPIPLEPPDPLIHLDLKAVLDRAYDSADYGKYIYQEMPEPPLSASEETWARSLVSQPVV